MRKHLLVLLIGSLGLSCSAQQLPLFSQYYFNSMVYNPSHTGIKPGTSVALTARKQFTGIATAIGTYAGTFQTRQDLTNSGFGLYVYSDDLNLFRTNSATGSYAYHIPLSDDNVLSFGLGLSLIDSRFNQSNFFLIDENDPVVANLSNSDGIAFDANAGVNVILGNFAMGLANLQLINNQESFTGLNGDKSMYTLASHWMFNASYKIPLDNNMELEPMLLYRKAPSAPGQTDLNLFLNWEEKGYAGIAYRDGLSVSAMIGVDITSNMTAGYAFDITTHKLRSALGNTHELMIQFDLGKQGSSASESIATAERVKYMNEINRLKSEVELAQANSTARIDTFIIEQIIEIPGKELAKEEKEKYERVIAQLENEVTRLKKGEGSTADKPVIVKEPVIDTPPSSGNIQTGRFYVIAGSFINSEAADNYMKQLKAKGYESNKKLDLNGRYYVYTSNHTTKESAVEYITKMKDSGLPLWIKSM